MAARNSSRRRPTIADVAARAGMSSAAVSLVLNDRPGSRISEDAVHRIRKAAEELNYRPNPAARSLRVGRTSTVGFISDEVTITRFASAMIRGMLDVADERDHGVLLAETGDHPRQLQKALDFMVDRQVDALIVGAVAAREIDLPPLPPGLRVIAANCTSPTVHHAVLPAEFDAGRQMAQLLLEAGHQDGIAILGEAPLARSDRRVSVTIDDRFRGIEAVFEEAGATPIARVSAWPWEVSTGYDIAVSLLDQNLPVSALICLNDRIAFGAYQALQERRIRVPNQISVASFDDDEVIADNLRPGLTTAKLPYEEMGRIAMGLALDSDAPSKTHRVPLPVQVRGSIATRPDAVQGE